MVLAAALGVAALAAIAVLVVRARGGKNGANDLAAPVTENATATTGGNLRTATTPPVAVAPAPAAMAAPADVTIEIETTPPGASVVGLGDGKVLGATPLTLTRPAHGPELKLRLEKEGYVSVARAVSLARDGTLDVTLERKPRPTARPRRPAVDEPARL